MDLTDSYSDLHALRKYCFCGRIFEVLNIFFAVEKIYIVAGSIGTSPHRYVKLASSTSFYKRSKNAVKSSDSERSLTATLISPNISEIETASCRYL